MKKHKTRKQKLEQRRNAGRGNPRFIRTTENATNDTDRFPIVLEADLSAPQGDLTGREWLVTIIGANDDNSNVLEFDGREYIESKNGRLYTVEGLRNSSPMWEGVKVYDNHQTPKQYEETMGMRSPVKEWLGSIVNVVWNEAEKKLQGVLKIVESAFAEKLKNAWEQGILFTIGLSIDSIAKEAGSLSVDGRNMRILDGFRKANSVDVVGNPAAGGAFQRILASTQREHDMALKEEVGALVEDALSNLDERIANAVTSVLEAALAEEEAEDVIEEEIVEEEVEVNVEIDDNGLAKKVEEALSGVKQERFGLMLDRKLAESNLPDNAKGIISSAFDGRIVEAAQVDEMIKKVKTTVADSDPTGRVVEAGSKRVTNVFDEKDKWAMSYLQKAMGDYEFRSLESNADEHVKESLPEFYKDWERNGRPKLPRTYRMSELVRDLLGGNPLTDEIRSTEASTLATVTKNTVNIMVAADYSLQQRWYEKIVRIHEVDTIDDVTLARLFGVDTLDVVNKGGAYTEIALQDEEETASFVKRGNIVAVPIEDLMRDKIDFFRTIPRRLSDTWFNTLSEQVSAVFTANTAAGPILADTGALFNATAVGTAGGHANLLTAALSWTSYGAARTAMRKQTNQPLGAGRKLQINPRFLLVPEDLETTALKIRNSEMQPDADGAGTAGNQSINPYYQKFEVICVPDWTDANDWALVGDPVRFPAIHLIFPRGNRIPKLLTADNPAAGSLFTTDTLQYKVQMMTFESGSTHRTAPVSDFRPLHKSNV